MALTDLLNERKVFDCISQFGSPLYVFDTDAFVKNYQLLLDSFRKIYPKYNIAYSYKTNYTPYICQLVKKMGGYAEVVSSMEYRLARRIGYSPDRIIFNGPVKGAEMLTHLHNHGVVNVDSLDELKVIVDAANANKDKAFKIAFRVNVDIGQSFISRFGIDSENGDLQAAFAQVNAIPNIVVVGIHCHVGRSRSVEAWKNRVTVMFALVDKYFDAPPHFIDLGSGMNSVMNPMLAAQFGERIPEYWEYADVVATAFQERYGSLPYEQQPELITEPGTTVVSGYLYFISTVQSIKRVKGKWIATFDGSAGNISEICNSKQLPITVLSKKNVRKHIEQADFVGYTCLEHDVLYRNYVGPLAIGDVVLFENIGSYSNVFKPPFISPNCAMISVEADGSYRLLKQKETDDDIFHTYTF